MSSKEELIKEMNELSTNFKKNKERMTEIAKILLCDHYGYKKILDNKKSE